MVRKGHHRIASRAAREDRHANLVMLVVLVLPLLGGCGESLHDAAAAGDLAAVRAKLQAAPRAIEARDKLGKTPLFFAISYNRVDMVEFLIEQGADVNAHDKTGLTPLHVAALMSRPACAELLIQAGAHVNAVDEFGDTPLHTAAIHGMSGMTGFLLKRGADINAKNNEGQTALDLALKYDHEKVVDTLRRFMDSGR